MITERTRFQSHQSAGVCNILWKSSYYGAMNQDCKIVSETKFFSD